MSTSIEACEKEISQKVFKLMEVKFESDAAIQYSLNLFESVSPASSFGWATYSTLHEAVATFSQSLIWSWSGGATNYAGAPEGSHEFVIECLAGLQLPSGIEVEAHLKNEFQATCKHYSETAEIEKAHRTLKLMAWLCCECVTLAKNSDKGVESADWVLMGRQQAIGTLAVSGSTLDSRVKTHPHLVKRRARGEYLVNPQWIHDRRQMD